MLFRRSPICQTFPYCHFHSSGRLLFPRDMKQTIYSTLVCCSKLPLNCKRFPVVKMTNLTAMLGNSSSGDKQGSATSQSFIIVSVFLLAAEIPVGCLGNLKVCLLLRKRKELRKAPHILLGNLSVAGLLVSIIHVPCYLVGTVWVKFFHKTIHPVFCITKYSVSVLLFIVQAFTLAAMATDRHDAVLRPFQRRITPENVQKLLKGIWSIACILTAVILPLSLYVPYTCMGYRPMHKSPTLIYTVVVGNVLLFGTIILIFATFLRIVKRLRSSPFPETYHKSEILVTRFSYALMFFFLLSWLPVTLFNIVGSAAGVDRVNADGPRILLMSVSNMNYLVNPFLHMRICKISPHASGNRGPDPGKIEMRTKEEQPKSRESGKQRDIEDLDETDDTHL